MSIFTQALTGPVTEKEIEAFLTTALQNAEGKAICEAEPETFPQVLLRLKQIANTIQERMEDLPAVFTQTSQIRQGECDLFIDAEQFGQQRNGLLVIPGNLCKQFQNALNAQDLNKTEAAYYHIHKS